MKYLNFPNETQWNEIYEQSPFPQILSTLKDLGSSKQHYEDFFEFLNDIEINDFEIEVYNRIAGAGKSFVMLTYYFEQGIPDDEWWVATSLDGKPVTQFLPHFEEKDLYTKDWFDYFVDHFYHMLFAAWDVLSHLIIKRYGLDLKRKRPSFYEAVNALESKIPELHSKLQMIIEHSSFKKSRKIRDNITHNRDPRTPGSMVKTDKEKTSGSFGVRDDYVTSREIIQNISEILLLFEATIQILKTQWAK